MIDTMKSTGVNQNMYNHANSNAAGKFDRKRVLYWKCASAISIWTILVIQDCCVAFDITPRRSFRRIAPLFQTIEGGPMKQIERWIIHLPKVKPNLRRKYTLHHPVNNDDESNGSQSDTMSRNIFRRGRKQTPVQMNIPRPIIVQRSVPKRLPRFQRYRQDSVNKEEENINNKVLPRITAENQATRSLKPMFWRRIKQTIKRHDKDKILIIPEDLRHGHNNTDIPITNTTLDDKTNFHSDSRIKFSAEHQESRFIALYNNISSFNLLHEYMSRPIGSFSIRSFHDDDDDTTTTLPSFIRNRSKKTHQHRRWLVRKLSIEETIQEGGFRIKDRQEENYFRLAVPLMPLIGVNLTPIVDLEVLSLQQNMIPFILESKSNNMLKIRSIRLSLLSREDEVRKAMENRKEKMQSPCPTKASQNQNIREMGNNAIEMVSKLEDIIKPYLSFDATITWSDKDQPQANKNPTISIKASTTASFTWTQKPVVHPFVLEKISSVILKRALKFGLTQILSQIDRDFKQWARHSDP